MKTITSILLMCITFFPLCMLHWSCEDKNEHLSLPSIQTIEVHNIVSTSVVSGGTIHFDGGAKIIEKGICWDINPLPTHNLITKRTSQINSSTFEIDITNLVPNTRYYIRAYAINNVGISYGNEVSFVTNSSSSIQYSKDGRTVQYGDLLPIALDISGDKEVDYTIFVEATASSKGVRLYAGVNPIRANLIKSGPPIDDNFLNMGLIIPQQDGSIIDHNLDSDQRWTSDFSALVIRNTDVAGVTTYEGHWSGQDQMVGVQFRTGEAIHYGWLRIKFDKITETVTLVDFAWNQNPKHKIKAGAISN